MAARSDALLERSIPAAVASTAYGHLEAGASALSAIEKGKADEDSLHTFRLSVRRLRTLLRDYGPWLGRAGTRKVERSLRRLSRATNDGRDAEVRLKWLQHHRKALPESEQRSARRAIKRLKAEKRKGYERAAGRVQADFTRSARRLVKRMKRPGTPSLTVAEVLPALLRHHSSELEVRLLAVRGPDDRERIHQARIAGKRFRYLMEPVAAELPQAAAIVNRLKELQDLLGELNDLHLVQETLDAELARLAASQQSRLEKLAQNGDAAAAMGQNGEKGSDLLGLEALDEIARDRRRGLFNQLRRTWLTRHRSEVFKDLEQLGETIEAEQSSVAGKNNSEGAIRAVPKSTRRRRDLQISR